METKGTEEERGCGQTGGEHENEDNRERLGKRAGGQLGCRLGDGIAVSGREKDGGVLEDTAGTDLQVGGRAGHCFFLF